MPRFRLKDLVVTIPGRSAGSGPGAHAGFCLSNTECGCTDVGTMPCYLTGVTNDLVNLAGDPELLARARAELRSRLEVLDSLEKTHAQPQTRAEAAEVEKHLVPALEEVRALGKRLTK